MSMEGMDEDMVHTRQRHSATEVNGAVPPAATWAGPGVVKPSELSQRRRLTV